MSTGKYNRSRSQRTVIAYASERSDNDISQCISSSRKLHSKYNVYQRIWNPKLGGVAVQEGENSHDHHAVAILEEDTVLWSICHGSSPKSVSFLRKWAERS